MTTLILVKHSLPQIEPGKPASEWSLSEEGRKRSVRLAERLAQYKLQHIFSSTETKAKQTAAIIAKRMDVPHEVVQGLHEHERRNFPIVSEEAYRAAAASLFQNPEHLIFGDETALQAGERFQVSLSVLLNRTDGDLVVVSHGTVISLFVAETNDVDAFRLWSQMGLPSFVVLSRPNLELLDVVAEV